MAPHRRYQPPRQRQVPHGDPNRPPIRTRRSTRPWPIEDRRLILVARLAGEEQSAYSQFQRQHYIIPSGRSTRRYVQRYRDFGHIRRFRRNGGQQRRVLAGVDLIHLALYRAIFPTATAAEVIAYLWNAHGRFLPEPRLYHPSQITRAEQTIGLTRKRNATTARQAFTLRNLIRRHIYWTQQYPYGISNIRAVDMIDVDEAVVNLVTANRLYGKAFTCRRARHEGPYQREGSTRLILAIMADPNLGRRWVEISHGRGGTTYDDFYNFILRIIIDLGPGSPQRRFCFILDNLIVHTNPTVLLLILVAGHRFVFRAPYWPKDAPIEYVFNTIENALTIRMHEIYSDADLARVIHETLRSILSFMNWFDHVGYS